MPRLATDSESGPWDTESSWPSRSRESWCHSTEWANVCVCGEPVEDTAGVSVLHLSMVSWEASPYDRSSPRWDAAQRDCAATISRMAHEASKSCLWVVRTEGPIELKVIVARQRLALWERWHPVACP